MDPLQTADFSLLQSIRVTGLMTGIFVLFVTWLLVRVVTSTLHQLGDRFTARRLLLNQAATLARFALYLTGITAAVAVSVTLSKDVVLAMTGTIAVTVGFALKDLAASVLSGIVIIIDRPFQVGDRVTFGGVYGEIANIGLRSVRLVTLDDNVVTIPNNKFLTEMVASGNWGALDMLIQMDFYVAADQDVHTAKQIVTEALTTSPYAYLGKPWRVLVSQGFEGEHFVTRLRAKAYVLDVQYERAFESDVTERVITGFRTHGIAPPAAFDRVSPDPLPTPDSGVTHLS